ncbi:MAG: BON domain-containing protein [Candidatus Hydrogenedentes bacterium]|nr:BON domain-containing protein [Candidatus Hydrogenedentota bacterium]
MKGLVRRTFVAATGVAIGVLAFTTNAAPIDKSVGDVAITARIETIYLMNGDLNPFKINTTTTDGVVTLTGVVRDQVDKDLAGRLAKTVKGVKDVQNELTVQRDVADVKENADWRQDVDDAALNARIRRQLAYNAGTKSAMLDIDVNGSTVIVGGEVDSAQKKKDIERVIDETSGVGRVESTIVVVEKKNDADAVVTTDGDSKVAQSAENAVEALSDEWIEKMVESRIMWNENLALTQVDVEVDNGVCKLSGNLPTQSQKDLAESIAQTTDGVKSVDSTISVAARG